jgi:hypothetical protein
MGNFTHRKIKFLENLQLKNNKSSLPNINEISKKAEKIIKPILSFNKHENKEN